MSSSPPPLPPLPPSPPPPPPPPPPPQTTTSDLLNQGAEAKIYIDTFDDNMCVIKERFAKKYRNSLLDKCLIRERMKAESKGIARAKEYGIKTPTVYSVDLDRKVIVMEFFEDAKSAKDFFAINHPDSKLKDVCEKIGNSIGKLHKNNMTHGDLTTSNILVNPVNESEKTNHEIIMIDFGLAKFQASNEDKAVDLNVLKRALVAHNERGDELFADIIRSYQTVTGTDEVVRKLIEVEARGRKKTPIG